MSSTIHRMVRTCLEVETVKQFTERDKEVLLFIQDYQYHHGYSPTVRDIARSLFISTTTAQRRLCRLVEMGYLSITPKTPRSIVLNIAV